MTAEHGSHDWIMGQAERIAAAGESTPRVGRDPVNQPMINNWVEAIGDQNPVYVDPDTATTSPHGQVVAPPAMAQVWTMGGLNPRRDPADPLYATMGMLDEAGFTSVIATNCEQSYTRYLRLGEEVSVTTRLESVVGPKRTALGEGYFVTTRNSWYVGDEQVAAMLFRVLKFKPASAQNHGTPEVTPGSMAGPHREATVIRPMVNRDSAYFWEGTVKGELRIQSCGACGELRHPPGPMCPSCHATEPSYVVASGRGSVYSFVVHRHPPVPGKELPIVIALVELEEGVRMVGELLDVAADEAEIGMPVEASFIDVEDELTLPAWRAAGRADMSAVTPVELAVGAELPSWELQVTPTLVVSTAIATRDFQDVHHDRDLAVERGSKDIFLNILTTTGLVQRYVTDQVGPAALVRGIAIRLGAPAYPGDALRFGGTVTEHVEVDGEWRYVVAVRGRNSLGDHVTGTVTFALGPEER